MNVLYAISERVLFPDIRGEWTYFAKRFLRDLLRQSAYDVVIASHEPATTLQLGRWIHKQFGIPFVADLGDPVLAPYTPRRWRRRSFRLERDVCAEAAAVTVTAESARDLLHARHGQFGMCEVIRQGFDAREVAPVPGVSPRLHLVYAGSFYAFRRADALFRAVAACDGIHLSVASIRVPLELHSIARRYPDKIRLVGFLSHSEALALQSDADVLVNIANQDVSQVPGKLFEYFGARRPILHLTQSETDPGAELVRSLRRGWVVKGDGNTLPEFLAKLQRARAEGHWLDDIDLSCDVVSSHTWHSQGQRLAELLLAVVSGNHARRASSTPGNAASFASSADS